MRRELEIFRVAGPPQQLTVQSNTERRVLLNAEGFLHRLLVSADVRSIDFLRVAAGVYAVDRIVRRGQTGARRIHVRFEVNEPALWRSQALGRSLESIVNLLTGDQWSFEFQRSGMNYQLQNALGLARTFKPDSVALYSGGLDSAAGLARRLLDGESRIALVTVGHHLALHQRVRAQIDKLRMSMRQGTYFSPRLEHSTLQTTLVGQKRMSELELTQRSRGFLFAAAAAVAATAYQVSEIELFENGVGALNLPLMTGMLFDGMASRGAHPSFLAEMGQLASTICNADLNYRLPFGDETKSEVLRSVLDHADLGTWLQETTSCIHTSIRQKGKNHCGCCPACIERRQAFAAAGVTEDTRRYQHDILSAPVPKSDSDYLAIYRSDAWKWLENHPQPRVRLDTHMEHSKIPALERQRYQRMQLRHAAEVEAVFGLPFARARSDLADRSRSTS